MNSFDLFTEYGKYILPIANANSDVMLYGDGMYLTDVEGNKLLDINGGQFCTIFGHSNDYIANVLNDINLSLVHTNLATYSLSMLKACKALATIMPELDCASIMFSTGSEALAFIQRYSRFYTNKNMIVTNDLSYLALSNANKNIETISTPALNNLEEVNLALKQFENYLKQDDVAAFIIEPIISMGGMVFLDIEFFKGLRRLCTTYGVMLVFDESQSGFGRSGKWYYYQVINVIPDVVISAKGIGNGYPISVVSVSNKFIDHNKLISSVSTHQNAPFAGSLILASIDYINDNQLLKANEENGLYFLNGLKSLASKYSIYINPRGLGMMCAVDFSNSYLSKDFITYARKNKLIVNVTNKGQTLRFVPPYIVEKKHIDVVLQIMEEFAQLNR